MFENKSNEKNERQNFAHNDINNHIPKYLEKRCI